jgi:DNA photolyase
MDKHRNLKAAIMLRCAGHSVLWFRKGLRLHDNGALHAALEASPQTLTPVFCLDPWQVHSTTLYWMIGVFAEEVSRCDEVFGQIAGSSEATMLASIDCSSCSTA